MRVNQRTIIIIYVPVDFLTTPHRGTAVARILDLEEKKLITLANRFMGRERMENRSSGRKKERSNERYKSVEGFRFLLLSLCCFYVDSEGFTFEISSPLLQAMLWTVNTCGKRGHWRAFVLLFLSTTMHASCTPLPPPIFVSDCRDHAFMFFTTTCCGAFTAIMYHGHEHNKINHWIWSGNRDY